MLNRASRAATVLLLSTTAAALAAPELSEAPATTTDGASVAAAPAKKHKKKRKQKHPRANRRIKGTGRLHKPAPSLGFGYRSSAGLGFQHGYGVRRFDSPLLELRAAWSPWRQLGPLRLGLPLEYQQLNLPAGGLAEYRGDATLRLSLRSWRRLQPFGAAEVTAVWRPNWPDLYQPFPNGELMPTDRFSYWRRRWEVGFQSLLGRNTKPRAAFSYSLLDYRQDPAFRPVDEPNHLPPGDRQELALKLGVGTTLGPLRPRFSLDLWTRDYFFVFARDRLTGKTHAGPRGLPPNPLYALRGADPELGFTLRLPIGFVRAAYGVQFVEDTFQGYYSSVAHHPKLTLRWLVTKKLSTELAGELSLRRYGADSYAEGPSHPRLTFGDRRVDRLGSIQVEASWKLSDVWSLVAEGKFVSRKTNFPSYEPGIFPRSARYDVQWSYDNWRLGATLHYRFRQLDLTD